MGHAHASGSTVGVAKRPKPRVAKLVESHATSDPRGQVTVSAAGMPSRQVICAIYVNRECASDEVCLAFCDHILSL